jgi:membrane-bound inhibitor of C-type lysozyme
MRVPALLATLIPALLLAGCQSNKPRNPIERLLGDPPWQRFTCTDGSTLRVQFRPDSATVQTRTRTLILAQAPAASGIRYEDGFHSLRGKGDTITLAIGRATPINCEKVG